MQNHPELKLPGTIAAATIVLVGVVLVFGTGLGLLGVGLLVAFLLAGRRNQP